MLFIRLNISPYGYHVFQAPAAAAGGLLAYHDLSLTSFLPFFLPSQRDPQLPGPFNWLLWLPATVIVHFMHTVTSVFHSL